MKAIITKYSPQNGVRGSRIIASDCDGNRVIFDHSLSNSHDEAHVNAARALCKKLGWKGVLIGPDAIDKNRYVFTWERLDTRIGVDRWGIE